MARNPESRRNEATEYMFTADKGARRSRRFPDARRNASVAASKAREMFFEDSQAFTANVFSCQRHDCMVYLYLGCVCELVSHSNECFK